jgi:hypothetical protein
MNEPDAIWRIARGLKYPERPLNEKRRRATAL